MSEPIPPHILLGAYAHGVFPMIEEGETLWFCPLNRGLIPLDERFHIPKSLRRTLRKQPFEIRHNHDFEAVMRACADRAETWIDENLIASYLRLHDLGYAHSFECWDDEGLQGGLYGVSLSRAFFGESMFSRKTDASKIALVHLVAWLRQHDYQLLDTQWMTDHLRQFGGYEVPKPAYLGMLQEAVEEP